MKKINLDSEMLIVEGRGWGTIICDGAFPFIGGWGLGAALIATTATVATGGAALMAVALVGGMACANR